MASAVGRIEEIDRRECRRIAEDRFSDHVIVDCYERLYRGLVHVGKGPAMSARAQQGFL